jgi:hypothetical protein
MTRQDATNGWGGINSVWTKRLDTTIHLFSGSVGQINTTHLSHNLRRNNHNNRTTTTEMSSATNKRPRTEAFAEDCESPPSRCSPTVSLVTPEKPNSDDNWEPLDQVPHLLLVELMKSNTGDVINALERLKDLFHENEKNRIDGIDMGAPGLISQTMRKFPSELEVQASGCTCLCWLTFQPRQKRVCAITARAGGVDAIVAAMKSFPDVDFINGDACSALANIFVPGDNFLQLQSAARSFVDRWEGLKLIRDTMKSYPDYAHLQASCCALLCHLARDDSFHEAMNQLDLVAEAAAALEHHYTDGNVKRNADIFIKEMLSI